MLAPPIAHGGVSPLYLANPPSMMEGCHDCTQHPPIDDGRVSCLTTPIDDGGIRLLCQVGVMLAPQY